MSITNASSASQNQLHIRQADASELNIEYEVNPFPYSFPTTLLVLIGWYILLPQEHSCSVIFLVLFCPAVGIFYCFLPALQLLLAFFLTDLWLKDLIDGPVLENFFFV